MNFTPKTEDELVTKLEGTFDATVEGATDKTSKAGNDMIELCLAVYDQDGIKRIVWDYVLEAMPHKLRHFCVAAGLVDLYETGTLMAQDCVGKNVLVKIKMKAQEGFPPKPNVEDYLLRDGQEKTAAALQPSDIPF